MIAVGTGVGAVLAGGAYALTSGGSESAPRRQFAGPPLSTTSTSARPTSTTEASTTTTSTTTAPAEEPPAPPQPDASIVALQERLAELGYDIGTPDGLTGWRTHYTIMAFQKVEGLDRTGEVSEALREALANASTPGPMVPDGESDRVEIDLNRQVMFLWRGGALTRILSVSTGNGEEYCVEGECDVAVTPTGRFRIGRKFDGLEVSRLGELYHPMYFYGGIAIHGSPSIPAYPASHGCVRVPMYASGSLYQQVPPGTTVYVVGDGPSAAVVEPPPDEPIQQQVPPVLPEPEPEPEPEPTTTTTEPAPTVDEPAITVPEITVPPRTRRTTVP